ncbi:MAG: NAD(P)/FAD-dependent oxidoreductase, partial [Oleibacter sp.]|nr:NAD(P)/FAD-dependent oxidoreductase [Thalassolituus sp.]
VVIGAGAAGLFCAAKAAQRGLRVLVIDHANKPGKKILMSGGGRCNFTNYFIEPARYLGQNPHFCKSALKRYTQWDFIALVEQYAIPYHEKKDGQLFCDHKASDILAMLLNECEIANVEIRMSTSITSVSALDKGYQLETSQGERHNRISCESLVIATGGPSIPTLGATGWGYELAKQFGLKVLPTRAGLVPFTITDRLSALCKTLSGTALAAEVSCNNTSFSDDMLFTHRGLSGPAMLQISSYWHEGDTLDVNLLPASDVLAELQTLQQLRPKSHLKSWLASATTQKFADQWNEQYPCPDTSLAETSYQALSAWAESLTHWQIKPSGTEGYRTAEVALGGVDTDELSSKTMETKRMPGLFFIGEVVDVTGHLGGYNFQWAWSSAAAAAEYV